ncbi:unnamed protein product [Lactuca saligna]|uniref:Uncharacterized protein n=1 Tax=Lactuca saligna TaxID=75948 RepID=A0AA36E5G9_LACSI|nr:unnamed protein product [Lactuca saligna]
MFFPKWKAPRVGPSLPLGGHPALKGTDRREVPSGLTYQAHHALGRSLASQSSVISTEANFKLLGDAYSLSSADEVDFPLLGSMIYYLPPGKVGIYLKTLDVGLCLPLSDFQEEIM